MKKIYLLAITLFLTACAQQTRTVGYTTSVNTQKSIAFISSFNDSCIATRFAQIAIVSQPANGNVTVVKSWDYPTQPAHCRAQRVEGMRILYKPNPNFRGSDSFTMQTTFPSGQTVNRVYTVEIR